MNPIRDLLDERSELLKQRKRLHRKYHRTSASTIDGMIARNSYAKEANALVDEIYTLTDKYNRMIEVVNQ